MSNGAGPEERDTGLSLDEEYLVRYRFPRPIARAFEEVLFSQTEQEEHVRVRWCANVAVRFLAVLRQANHLAASGASFLNAPSASDLKLDVPPNPLPSETAAPPRATRLLRLADIYPGRSVHKHRKRLLHSLAKLSYLAEHRLAVVEPDGLRILLGSRTEYRVAASQSGWDHARLLESHPKGTPLLVDPRTGRYLSLGPLAVWQRDPREPLGHMLWLRKVWRERGYYIEEGMPGAPGGVFPLRGWPALHRLGEKEMEHPFLGLPSVRFDDDQEAGGSHHVYGLIWRGGTGDIFVARRLETDEPVVLKTFEGKGTFDENFYRFLNEEKYSTRVSHPGVVGARRVVIEGHGQVLEQEFVRQGSLQDYLENNGVLTTRVAVRVVASLLQILDALHRQSVAHNDLKPDNVLFSPDGRVRLIDFGIAFDMSKPPRTLRSGAIPGTPGYMAPELRSGGRPSVQSDLYAAGILLVQMLANRVVSSCEGALEERSVASELHPFVCAMLAEDPARRYGSAREALEALSRVETRDRWAITLDVEGTLVTDGHDKAARPHLGAFLQFCLERFDRIFVCTLLDELQTEEVFSYLLARDLIPDQLVRAYEYVEWPRTEPGALKDLRFCRFPMVRNLIVDDMESMIPEDQVHRWIRVPDYEQPSSVDEGLILVRKAIERKVAEEKDLPLLGMGR
jgi:serine/threonine-protein kinase